MESEPSVSSETAVGRRLDDIQAQLVELQDRMERLEQHLHGLDELREAVAYLKEELEERTEF